MKIRINRKQQECDRAARGGGLRGFTILEMMVALGVVSVLVAMSASMYSQARRLAMSAASASNLRELVQANLLYAADNKGRFCPAQDPRNLVRWHGGRNTTRMSFDPSKGFLSPYLMDAGKARICPVFAQCDQSKTTFEKGAGGYGYNEMYIGGTPASPYTPELLSRVREPAKTIMFTDAALPRGDGLQEYPYSEPYRAVFADGSLSGKMQPSVHFRHDGLAHVAWCDGSVTAEPPARIGGINIYGGDGKKYQVGWVGPEENNGWWNSQR